MTFIPSFVPSGCHVKGVSAITIAVSRCLTAPQRDLIWECRLEYNLPIWFHSPTATALKSSPGQIKRSEQLVASCRYVIDSESQKCIVEFPIRVVVTLPSRLQQAWPWIAS